MPSSAGHYALAATELLRSMKNKEFDTLIVFDRDRLARNMVEYLVIIEQAIENGVEIIFSNSEAERFSNKLDVEADLALYAEMEGKKINQRVAAVRKYYPPAPYGYEKVGKRSDTRYVQIEEEIEQAKIIFNEFENIKTKSEFIQFKKRWEPQKRIDCKKILTNPFYAAVIIHTSGFIEPLNHIKGIVRKETILENRQKINSWGYNSKRERPYDPYFNNLGIPLICGECNQPLKFTRKNNEVSLSCNHGINGQKNVTCTVTQLKLILQNHVQNMIERLDSERLRNITHSKISEHMRMTRRQVEKLEHERINAIKQISGRSYSAKSIIQSVEELDEQIARLNKQNEQLEFIDGKIIEFVSIINSEFHRHFPEQLNEVTRMLVKEIRVGKDYVDIQTRTSECLKVVV